MEIHSERNPISGEDIHRMSVTSTELLLMVEEIERSMDYLECMKDILHDTTRMNDIRKMHFEVKQFLQTLSKSKAMKVKNV